MELTQQHLDAISNTAIAVNKIVGRFDEINQRLTKIKTTLDVHTQTLDELVKNTIDWNTEMASVRIRLQIHN